MRSLLSRYNFYTRSLVAGDLREMFDPPNTSKMLYVSALRSLASEASTPA